MLQPLIDMFIVGIFFGLSSALVAILISPLQFIKVNRQATGFSYTKIIYSTIKIKGVRAFFRGAIPYGIMNFLSSMAFGFSQYFSNSLPLEVYLNILGVIIFRSVLAGVIETIFSIHAELREISLNKGSLIISKPKVSNIFMAILLRNIIFWMGALISFELEDKLKLTKFMGIILSLVFGIICAVLTITLDVVATQNCGSLNKIGVWSRFKKLFKKTDEDLLLAGVVIRIIQVGIFTASTVVTMSLYEQYLRV